MIGCGLLLFGKEAEDTRDAGTQIILSTVSRVTVSIQPRIIVYPIFVEKTRDIYPVAAGWWVRIVSSCSAEADWIALMKILLVVVG